MDVAVKILEENNYCSAVQYRSVVSTASSPFDLFHLSPGQVNS